MLVFFLLLVIVAMALGILGILVKGLLYLLFTGIGVLLLAFVLGPCGCGGGPREGATPGNSPRRGISLAGRRRAIRGRRLTGRRRRS